MSRQVAIISPCFNEQGSIREFLELLKSNLASVADTKFHVVLVDDGSQDETVHVASSFDFQLDHITFHLLTLQHNVGHQKAIYQGLLYAESLPADYFIVMDADGEDDPAIIPALISETEADIVFVTRGKRQEGLLFRIGYFFYGLTFRLIINKKINFGNFSMIRRNVLTSVLNRSFIHYSASLSKLRFKKKFIRADRKKRLQGESKMSYNGLVLHGLKAFVEYADDMLIFFLKMFSLLFIFFIGLGINILYQKFVTHMAILGWASVLLSVLFNAMLIILCFFLMGVLLLNIHDRSSFQRTALYTTVTKASKSKPSGSDGT